MFKKECPHCGGPSYSASDCGVWNCPYCGKDLSSVAAGPAINGKKETHSRTRPVKPCPHISNNTIKTD